MSPDKSYLGDGVFADLSPLGEIILTTEDGIKATNTIVLEPPVVDALIAYIKHARGQ